MSTTVLPPPAQSGAPPRRATRFRWPALVRGAETDARWARPALLALLAFTAIAYIWNLKASGYANSFYSAAVQAGTKSWKAFFFGSIDSSNFITVDKPPASLWVMELSGRLFGFSSLSMLIPEVLEGLAAVALLYGAVKRWFGASAGLIAGGLLAVTPVAALMFRFNNPDALLVCLLVAGAYCLTRALERASTRWIVAAGTMVGFAFLAKMMQAFLVLPAFALVYMVAAPTGLRRRTLQVLAGGAATVVSAGWWVAIVALWPVGSRPMIDGSSDNSIINLILGYNGLGRIFGAGGGGGGGGSFSGNAGALRLFNDLMGGQASWLLPAAVMVLVGGLVVTWRAARTDRTRAALLLWGGWLVVSAAVFSYSTGIIHTYYTVALAPAIAALVAIGAVALWRHRDELAARLSLAGGVAVTAAWAWVLLHRTSSWLPWLSWLIAVGAVLAIAGLLMPYRRTGRPRLAAAVATCAAIACLAGPVAYAAQTVSTAHTGSTPSAGPSTGMGMGGAGSMGSGSMGSGASRSGTKGAAALKAHSGSGMSAGGGAGQSTVSKALVAALESDASHYRWVAATSGSESAASLELATGGDPVMAIGGFNGQGGNLTLAQFKAYVAKGEIHYYIAGSGGQMGGGGMTTKAGGSTTGQGPGGSSHGSSSKTPTGALGGGHSGTGAAPGNGSSSIAAWVKAHYKSVTIGGETVYDLTQAK